MKKIEITNFSIQFLQGYTAYEIDVKIEEYKLYTYPYKKLFDNINFRLHFLIIILSNNHIEIDTLWMTLDNMSVDDGINHLKLK